MKINARLDEQSEKDLRFIKEQTGETVTRIIKELLADKAAALRQKHRSGSKMQALLESDFVGCAEGPEDLSVNYSVPHKRGDEPRIGSEFVGGQCFIARRFSS